MQKIILKIYLKNKRRPLCEITLSSMDLYKEFIELLNDNNSNVIEIGQVSFAKSEFRYAVFKYK